MKVIFIYPDFREKKLAQKLGEKHEVILVTKEEIGGKTPQEFINKNQPDFVYVNSITRGEWLVASRKCKVKSILYLQERKEEYLRLLLAGKVKVELMDNVDILLCSSPTVKRDVEEFFLSFPPVCEVLEGNLDCDKILEETKLTQPLPKNAFGEIINKEKPIICAKSGWEIFVKTTKKLPQLQFLWLGELDKATQLDNLFGIGKVESYYFYLSLADLLVVCSEEKGEKLVEEALVLGKQAVCFSKAGESRFLLDKKGYVINGEANVDLLVRFIQRLFTEEKERIFVPQWLEKVQGEIIRKNDKFALFAQIL